MAVRVSAPRARPERPPDSATPLLTAEEFLALTDTITRTELVDGRVVDMPPAGNGHGVFSARVIRAADRHSADPDAFEALTSEPGFTLRRDPDTVRAPDVAFVTPEHLAPQLRKRGFYEGAPDIAVEVISESQTRAQVEDKVAEYLEAGGRLVWVIDPEARVARVYRPGAQVDEVAADGVLSGEDVIPGLMVPLADVFR